MSAVVINVSGPYGVGKDTVLNSIIERHSDRSLRLRTITTRPGSPSADPSYLFLSGDTFRSVASGGRWLVNEQGLHSYGTSLDELEALPRTDLVGLHSVYSGPAGAGALRRTLGSRLLSIGLLATGGSLECEVKELEKRMVTRNRDTLSVLADRGRSQAAKVEYVRSNPEVESCDGRRPVFDVVLVNATLLGTLEAVFRIIDPIFQIDRPSLMRSDAEVRGAALALPHIGGSYFEPSSDALDIGRVLLRPDQLDSIGSILRPRYPEAKSYHLSTAYAYLRSRCMADESLYGLYRVGSHRYMCSMLFSVEQLSDYSCQEAESLSLVAYLAISNSAVDELLR